MTSVLNHQQPLSGNKFIWLGLIFVTVISCGAIKTTTETPSSVPSTPNTPVVVDSDEVISSEKEEAPAEEANIVDFHGDKYLVKPTDKTFTGIVVLPFSGIKKSAKSDYISSIMLSYLQGVEMAFKGLEEKGLKLDLKILDSKNEEEVLEKLLEYKSMKKADFIVGPITSNQLELVSNFGKTHEIPIFSPFTQLDSLAHENTLFYNFHTPEYFRAVRLAEHVAAQSGIQKIIIYRDGKSFDKRFVPFFVEALRKLNVEYALKPFSKYTDWAKDLSEDEAHHIFVSSVDKNMISTTLGTLYSSKRNVTTYLSESVLDDKNNEYRFWNDLNVHVMTDRFVNYSTYNNKDLRNRFRLEYHIDPNKYAVMGYDQFSFIGECIATFGNAFPAFIADKQFDYSNSSFHFTSYGNCFQNSHLTILKFEEYQLIKAN